jgi:hypothetical protein
MRGGADGSGRRRSPRRAVHAIIIPPRPLRRARCAVCGAGPAARRERGVNPYCLVLDSPTIARLARLAGLHDNRPPGHVNIEVHDYAQFTVMIRQGDIFHIGAGATVSEAAENLCKHIGAP